MTDVSVLTAPIINEFDLFKAYYNNLFVSQDVYTQEILDFVKSSSGKRLRPILVLLVAKACSRIDEKIFSLASAFEILHTGSLIHDDVVDESEIRRGRPSVNSRFSNKIAVLAGDFVIALALNQMAKTGKIENIRIMSDLSERLSEGEIIQQRIIQSQEISEKSYFDVISNKTASLFASCAKASSYTSGADEDIISAYTRFGYLAGLCFQIKDDILDYVGSDNLGKPVGNDLKEGKFTLPSIYAISNSDIDWSEKIACVKSLQADQSVITSIINFTVENGGIDYAYSRMNEIRKEAVSVLPSKIPDDIRQSLISYIDLIIKRDQ